MTEKVKLIVLLIVAVILLVIFINNRPDGVVYDCRLAEISPDFPPEAKEQCRRTNYEEWRRQNQQKGSIIHT